MTKPDQLYLKYPINLACSALEFKDYVRYLYIKKIDRNGFVKFSDMRDNKNTHHNWMRLLIKRGWATKVEGGYRLESYQHVWRSLGVKRVKRTNKLLAFKYLSLPSWIKTETPKKFFDYCINYIRQEQARRKKEQIVFRLLSRRGVNQKTNKKVRSSQISHIKITMQPEYSTNSARELFGYKSATTGRKMLIKYMAPCLDAIPKREWKCVDGKPVRRYTSWRIWL